MPINTDPIYVGKPAVSQGGAILGPSANTAQDGTGANITRIFTADSTYGSRIDKIVFKSVGSPAATVIRVFYYSGTGTFTPGTSNTAANTTMIAEATAPVITTSNTVAQNPIEIPLNINIPPGTGLLVTFGTSTGAAGTGYAVTVFGGDYTFFV